MSWGGNKIACAEEVVSYQDTKKFIHPLVLANSFNQQKKAVNIKLATIKDFIF